MNESNAYEILEVEPGATRREIERAYYLARLAYGTEALASYSLYSTAERTAILERIEKAYRILTNQEDELAQGQEAAPEQLSGGRETDGGSTDARTFEDSSTEAGGAPRNSRSADSRGDRNWGGESRPGADLQLATSGATGQNPLPWRPIPRKPLPSGPVVEPIEIPGPYDGPTLGKIRKARGFTLDDIAKQTKISMSNLRLIESNAYKQLPAPVYLRGFLSEYARCLRLNSVEVVRSYLEVADAAASPLRRKVERDG